MSSTHSEETLDALPDKALMALASNGNPRAFATLVLRHQGGVLNFFYRMGDYTHAEDRTQEVFVRLYLYRTRYRPRAKFTTFLYLLARRVRIDHCRSEKRRREGHRRYAAEVSVRSTPESNREALDDVKDAVTEALLALSDEMRAVVVLNVFQGLAYKEIAEIMRIPLGTVKTRMFHAMRKLREILGDENKQP